MPCSISSRPYFFANPIQHLRRVECPRHRAWPALAPQHPAQQHRKNLVRIDKVSILIRRADPVRIAIGTQPGIALVRNRCLAQRANVRLDRLRIDSRKQRIDIPANLHVIYADARKNIRQDCQPRSVHRVDRKLHPRLRNQIEIGEALNRLQIRRQKINLFNRRRLVGLRHRLVKIAFNRRNNRRLARPAVPCLVLHAVPLRGIVRRRNHDAARSATPAHAVAQCRRRRYVVGQRNWNPARSHNFSACPRKSLRPEACVIADAKALRRIFLRVNIRGNCGRRRANIGKSKVVGDDAAPAVSSKLDLWMGHTEIALSLSTGVISRAAVERRALRILNKIQSQGRTCALQGFCRF